MLNVNVDKKASLKLPQQVDFIVSSGNNSTYQLHKESHSLPFICGKDLILSIISERKLDEIDKTEHCT